MAITIKDLEDFLKKGGAKPDVKKLLEVDGHFEKTSDVLKELKELAEIHPDGDRLRGGDYQKPFAELKASVEQLEAQKRSLAEMPEGFAKKRMEGKVSTLESKVKSQAERFGRGYKRIQDKADKITTEVYSEFAAFESDLTEKARDIKDVMQTAHEADMATKQATLTAATIPADKLAANTAIKDAEKLHEKTLAKLDTNLETLLTGFRDQRDVLLGENKTFLKEMEGVIGAASKASGVDIAAKAAGAGAKGAEALGGAAKIAEEAKGLAGMVMRNPKTALGVAIAGGLAAGALLFRGGNRSEGAAR